MKVSRLFTIDVEIAEKLKEFPNQSKYVNDLLNENLQNSHKNTSILQQKEANLSNFKKKMAQIRREIKIFSKFEELGLDNYCIRWIKGQETEPSIWSAREYIRSRGLEIQTEKLISAYKLIKENGNLFEKY